MILENFKAIVNILIFILIFNINFAYCESYNNKEDSLKVKIPKLIRSISNCVIKIESIGKDGTLSQGTGFLFSYKLDENNLIYLIVTNKHVVKDSMVNILSFPVLKDGIRSNFRLKAGDLGSKWFFHEDENIDLAFITAIPLFNLFKKENYTLLIDFIPDAIIPNDEDYNIINASSDIIMIGFPLGLSDEKNSYPLFRKGIAATNPKIDYNGKREFLIDLACFPGSSGSPVFSFVQKSFYESGSGIIVKFIGVLYAGPHYTADGKIIKINVPTKLEVIPVTNIPTNLGYVIKSEVIIDYIKKQIKNGTWNIKK